MNFETLIEKYVDAGQYRGFFFTPDGDDVFYLGRVDDAYLLHHLKIDQATSLAEGRILSGEDFSQGTFVIRAYDRERDFLYLALDRNHREFTNVWRMRTADGTLQQLTFSHNDQGPHFSKDMSLMHGCDVRKLEDGTFQTTVYELDLRSLERRDLFSDEGWDYRLGWTHVIKADDEDAYYFSVDYMSQRRRTNVARWDARSKTVRRLLPEWLEESGRLHLHANRVAKGLVDFMSFHEGFENVYRLDTKTGKFTALTSITGRVQSLFWTKGTPEEATLLATWEDNRQYWCEIRDRYGVVRRIQLPCQGWVFRGGEKPWIYLTGADVAPSFARFDPDSGKIERRLSTLAVPAESVENTKSRWVEYESFDGLKIPALLMEPRGALRGAIVVSFYGGENMFNSFYQMFADLGFAVLSPAVRGSWGWGRAWESKIVGDLGGAEIRDAIEGGRFVAKELGLPAEKVGIYGGSHGGFATLRAITYPDVRGEDPRYPFGFAITEVGFADLVAFYKDSRIADWLVHLLGPYNEELYRERSPVTHFDRLQTPLLVINGTNDTRVPYSTMEGFIEKLKASDRPHRLHLHVGQGHHAATRETIREDRRAVVEFLRDFVLEKRT